MGYILDLLVIAVFAVFILMGARNGFIRAVTGLLGSFGAFIAAGLLSRPIASGIFDLFFKGPLSERIQEALMEAGGTAASDKAAAVLENLPGFLSGYVQAGQLEGQLESAVNGAAATATGAVVSLISPLFISFIQYIVFFLLFLVASLIIRTFSAVLQGLFRAPVLGSINSLLGGLFGALRAFILCLLIGLVLFWIAPQPGESSLFSPETMNQSSLFAYFYSTQNLIISLFSSL